MTKDRQVTPINRFKIKLLEWLFPISQTAIYPPFKAAEKIELELYLNHKSARIPRRFCLTEVLRGLRGASNTKSQTWRSMFAYNLFQGSRDIRIAKTEAMLEQL